MQVIITVASLGSLPGQLLEDSHLPCDWARSVYTYLARVRKARDLQLVSPQSVFNDILQVMLQQPTRVHCIPCTQTAERVLEPSRDKTIVRTKEQC